MSSLAAMQVQAAVAGLSPRRRRRLRRPPRQLYPELIERRYRRRILDLLEPARELVDQQLVPRLEELLRDAGLTTDAVRTDDYTETIGRVFDNIRLEYEGRITRQDVAGAAGGAARQLDLFNKEQVGRQVKAVLGIDVALAFPGLDSDIRSFTRENVALIQSIPTRYFAEIETLVLRSVRTGVRAETIAEDLKQRYSVGESRATLIARDQVGKFNGHLTRVRHQSLGLRRYRWRTSLDERVRGNPGGRYPKARHSHWDREGKVYSYDDPPEDGHPGHAIQCRCWAEPLFEDLLGGDESETTPGSERRRSSSSRRKRKSRSRVASPAARPRRPRFPLPENLPAAYRKQSAFPAGRFDRKALLEAAKSPRKAQVAGRSKLDAERARVVRQQLNALFAERGLVSHDILGQVALSELMTGSIMPTHPRWLELTGKARHHATELVIGKPRSFGVLAYHDSRGKIMVNKRDFDGFVRYWADPSAATAAEVRSLHVVMHATMHSHSPLGPGLYRVSVAAKFEEATTELAARQVTESIADGWTFTDAGEKSVRGAYTALTEALVGAVAEHAGIPPAEALRHVKQAAVDMRKTAKTFDTTDAYVGHFVDQLPGSVARSGLVGAIKTTLVRTSDR